MYCIYLTGVTHTIVWKVSGEILKVSSLSIMWVSDPKLKPPSLSTWTLYPLSHLTGPCIVVILRTLGTGNLRACESTYPVVKAISISSAYILICGTLCYMSCDHKYLWSCQRCVIHISQIVCVFACLCVCVYVSVCMCQCGFCLSSFLNYLLSI